MGREDEGRARGSRRIRLGLAPPPFDQVRNNALVSSTDTIAAKNHPLSYGTRIHRRGNDENEGRGWSDAGQ